MRKNLNERGVSLVTVLVITAILAILGSALLQAVYNGYLTSRRVTKLEYSYFSADSAIESFSAGVSYVSDKSLEMMEDQMIDFDPNDPDSIVKGLLLLLKSDTEYLDDIATFLFDENDSINVRYSELKDAIRNGTADVEIIYDTIHIIKQVNPLTGQRTEDYIIEGGKLKVIIAGEAIATYYGPDGESGAQRIHFQKTLYIPFNPYKIRYAIQSVGDVVIENMTVDISGGINAYGTSPRYNIQGFPGLTEYDYQRYFGGVIVKDNSNANLTGDIVSRSSFRVGADEGPGESTGADIALLVDCSASMDVIGVRQAKDAVLEFMKTLADKDINANIVIIPYCGSGNNYFEMAATNSLLESKTYELQPLIGNPAGATPEEKINSILLGQQEHFINAEKVGDGGNVDLSQGVDTIIGGLKKLFPGWSPDPAYISSGSEPDVVIERTNYGDALRRAYHTLNNGSGNKNFIVFMSDGEPSAYTVDKNDSTLKYFGEDNITESMMVSNWDASFETDGGWNYAEDVLFMMNDDAAFDFNFEFVGFNEADLVKTEILNMLVNSGIARDSAAADELYRPATSANLNSLYKEIADKISTQIDTKGNVVATDIRDVIATNIFASGLNNDATITRNAYVLRNVINTGYENKIIMNERLFGLSGLSFIDSLKALSYEENPLIQVDKEVYINKAVGEVNVIKEYPDGSGYITGYADGTVDANGTTYNSSKFSNDDTLNSIKNEYVVNDIPEFLRERDSDSLKTRFGSITSGSDVKDILYNDEPTFKSYLTQEMEIFVDRDDESSDTITHSLDTGPIGGNLLQHIIDKIVNIDSIYDQIIRIEEDDYNEITNVMIQDIEALGTGNPTSNGEYYVIVCEDPDVNIVIQDHTYNGLIVTKGKVVIKNEGFVNGAIIAAGRGYNSQYSSIDDLPDGTENLPKVYNEEDYEKMMRSEFAAVHFQGGVEVIPPSTEGVPPEVALVVDLSGSMNDGVQSEDSRPSRITVMHQALLNFISNQDLKDKGAKITLIPYTGSANNYYGRALAAQEAIASGGTFDPATTVPYKLYDINNDYDKLKDQIDLMIRVDSDGKGEIGEARYFKNYVDAFGEFGQEIAEKAFAPHELLTSYNPEEPDDDNFLKGTNIGDGIRRGYYALEGGDEQANKYLITMTDGNASRYTVDANGIYFEEDWDISIDNWTDSGASGNSAEGYMKAMAQMVAQSGIITEHKLIAVSADADAVELEEDTGIPSFQALNPGAVEQFYQDITGSVQEVPITPVLDSNTRVKFQGEGQSIDEARESLIENIGIEALDNII